MRQTPQPEEPASPGLPAEDRSGESPGDPAGDPPRDTAGERRPRARRRASRKIALETLYEHDMAGRPCGEILDRYAGQASLGYATRLVDEAGAHSAEIDGLIEACAEDWALARMPPIDRNLLRLGVVELVYLGVAPGVAINEAVDLAKLYSTADSGRFVNGILARIARDAAGVGS